MSPPDYHGIYDAQAEAYDRLVSAEDCDGHLAAALADLAPAGGLAVDVGAGTGRLARLLLEAGVGHVVAVEPAAAMLAQAGRRLAGAPVDLRLGAAAALPVADGVADLVVAGWVFGHFAGWHPEDWAQRIDAALEEFDRVSAPGAVQIIIETMGTATAAPGPPRPRLARYYDWLEARHGFSRRVVVTDYLFDSPQAAAEATRFFFGDEVADGVLAEGRRRVPEWTGIFSRRR